MRITVLSFKILKLSLKANYTKIVKSETFKKMSTAWSYLRLRICTSRNTRLIFKTIFES